MSKGKPTPETVVELVRSVWLTNQGDSGAQIHREFERLNGRGIVSRRKVQQLISEEFTHTSTGQSKEPFPLVVWDPWKDKRTDPTTQAFLLRLEWACRAERRKFFEVQARWGERLSGILEGLNIHDQLQIVRLYAAREVSGYYFDTSPMTGDLDAMCAYQPWHVENSHAYSCAVGSGLAPIPVFDGVEFAGEWAVGFFQTASFSGFSGKKLLHMPRVVSQTFDEMENQRWVDEARAFWKPLRSPKISLRSHKRQRKLRRGNARTH